MVSNKVLQNETYSTSDESFGEYKLLGDRGMNSQSSAEFFDNKTNVLFYTMVSKCMLERINHFSYIVF